MIERAKQLVADADRRSTNVYTSLAKAALWLASIILVWIVVTLSVHCVEYGGYCTANLSIIVEACQVLVVLSVTVMGWHGYKGSRIFHLLRHWNDSGTGEQ